jgi:TRAP transporter TAXI family solute receptor
MRKFTMFVLMAVFAFSGLSGNLFAKQYVIATATTGGTYYPVGVAIATLTSIKLRKQKITANAISSAGSGENVDMLKNKEVDFAILQGLFGAMAYQGKMKYEGKPMKDMRSVTMLWQNVEHFVVLKNKVKTGTIEDLKNFDDGFSIGKRGSGTEGSGRVILSAFGIEPDKDFRTEYLGYTPSAQAMMDNRIAGANIPAGPPVSAITQLFATLGNDKVRVLNFTDAQLNKVRDVFPIWTRFVIKAGTYPGQKNDINTIAQPNFLAVRPDIPEEDVYKILKNIYDNLPFLHNIHKATMAMSLDRAINGLVVPLHPGAVKFYKEKGIKVPDYLIAK